MTWGEQNTEEEAWEQLDYAVSQGINFIDTGVAVPFRPCELQLTEQKSRACCFLPQAHPSFSTWPAVSHPWLLSPAHLLQLSCTRCPRDLRHAAGAYVYALDSPVLLAAVVPWRAQPYLSLSPCLPGFSVPVPPSAGPRSTLAAG